LSIKIKGERRAIIEHRKFYSGYLKGLHNASKIRAELMLKNELSSIEDILSKYLEELLSHNSTVQTS
jgi:tRNA-dihydrouridine synthase B